MIEIFGVNPDFLDSGKDPILSAAPEIQDIIRQGHEQSLPMQSIPLLKPSPKYPLSQIIRNPQDAEQTSFCHIPALPKCDGAIQIFSNGISEGFRSGDIILFRSIKSIDMVQWGEDYLICFTHGEEERATLRRVYTSARKGYIRLCTSDRDQQDLELEISRIKAIAEVRASIRIHCNL